MPKKLPSAEELRQFGDKFTKAEWESLCNHREFMNVVLVNLKAADKLAMSILDKTPNSDINPS
jgi:hypothetical protein